MTEQILLEANSSDDNRNKEQFHDVPRNLLRDSTPPILPQVDNKSSVNIVDSITGILNVPPLSELLQNLIHEKHYKQDIERPSSEPKDDTIGRNREGVKEPREAPIHEKHYKQHIERPSLEPKDDIIGREREGVKELREAVEDALATKRFKAAWNESADSLKLSKGPVGPVIKELGEQLAAGTLDPEKLQKLMKDVTFSKEDRRIMDTLLQRFSADLKTQFGIDVHFNFGGKGENMVLDSISVEENRGPHQFNLRMNINSKGEVSAAREFTEGFVGPSIKVLTTEEAMKRFKEMIRNSKENPLP